GELRYFAGHYDDPESYRGVGRLLAEIDARARAGKNRIFYLSTPPSAYETIIRQIEASGLARGEGWARIVVEKPFGRDLESARALNRTLAAAFDEEQVYRIDHYLGKDTVQN